MNWRRHWLWLLLLIPIVIGTSRLHFDVDVLNLLPRKLPVVRGLKIYQQNFANSRELLITVESTAPEQTETAARKIAEELRSATNLIATATWQPPWLEHPERSAELVASLWLNQPPEVFAQLTNRLHGAELTNTLVEAREQLTASLSPGDIAFRQYDPFRLMSLPESSAGNASSFGQGEELFSSPDGTFRIIVVKPRTDLSNYRTSIKWLEQVKALVHHVQTTASLSGVKIGFTGGPAFVADVGGGMERDMRGPSAGTLAVIAILFYYTHRRWLPLIWLIVLLVLLLGGTLALGGLFFGTLNVVSLGFASILLGLAEDFAIVLYQESRSHPELSLSGIRRSAAPGIFWSAVTTSGAFLLLNLSGLPGLGQLGSLVAIGIVLAAIVMLFGYLPPLLRREQSGAPLNKTHGPESSSSGGGKMHSKSAWATTLLLVLTAGIQIWKSPPQFDHSPDSLRPRNSEAYEAMAKIKSALGQKSDPLWLLIEGKTETEIAQTLQVIEPALNNAVSNDLVASFTLPVMLWPNPAFQEQNKRAALSLIAQEPTLTQAALSFGFTSNSLALTKEMFRTWQRAGSSPAVFWPTNENSRWVMEKIAGQNTDSRFALGLVYTATNTPAAQLTRFAAELPPNVHLSGWELLGFSISQMVLDEMPLIIVPILLVVIFSLWLAFRSIVDVLLSFATLLASAVFLLLVMQLAGWTWNMMNLMAVPLLLGMGVDFSIHIQLALRRYGGSWAAVRGSIGRALLLAGSTTVAGFASLAFSSNAGVASLGKVCAAGIACTMLISIYLLPAWWTASKHKS